MDKLNAMMTFVQIVDSGSMTAAAESMDTSLPTIVRTLANLEKNLQTRLLTRTTRKITLTVEGRGYLTRCRDILADIEDAELELNSLRSQPSGKLSITASMMFGSQRIAPLVNQFIEKNPLINVDLLLVDRNVNLVEEGIDVAIRIGELADSTMVAKKVGSVRRVVCGTPKLLNTFDKITHPKELTKLPCILFSGLSHGSHWQFNEKERKLSISVKGPLACNNINVAFDAVMASMGLGMFLSYQVEEQVASGELQIVLPVYEFPAAPVSIVYSHSKLMSTRVRSFVDWISKELQNNLAD
jgi:DNA-binding transcriptional LysR family regulator